MKPKSFRFLKQKNPRRLAVSLAALALALPTQPLQAAPAGPAIVSPAGASWLETVAAHEVRRYIYLRTGLLLPIQTAVATLPANPCLIVVARKDRDILNDVRTDPVFKGALTALGPESFALRTVESDRRQVALIVGGDDIGTLYAAYRFAEHLGVRFYLHGDVIPDRAPEVASAVSRRKGAAQLRPAASVNPAEWLPVLDEECRPLFALRGIQPFHDFPEGPDWWDRDDYLAIIGQLPKLGMNFIGLHTYPEGRPNAEPTVWIGMPQDVEADGHVRFSYPASYQNTFRGNWGYTPMKTSGFSFGAWELFDRDAYGPEVMRGACPEPTTPQQCNAVFDQTAAMLHSAFSFAHEVGVKTCVGTETPLVIPKVVAARLRATGKDPTDPAVVEQLYEGIFHRIALAYPLDYYWFWTPENWTWNGVKASEIQATTNDLSRAIAAARQVHPSFKLATCGWVLGPPQDRAWFAQALPKDVALSCINREVGRTPVDKAFAEIHGRSKWAISWLEDDPGLTSPQLWVGRVRRDARDALAYGCDGLMGIHWRTRVLGPNVAALAQAAWDQGAWNRPAQSSPKPATVPGPVGGQVAAFPSANIAGTDEGPIYRTVRYNLSAYHLAVSNGLYRVTLKFCEPHYTAAGRRVFGVRIQGRTVLDRLDIFARVGKDRPLDYTFDYVLVTNGWLDIDFVPETEFPILAGIVLHGDFYSNKINCGGPAWRDYHADWPPASPPQEVYPPTADFYTDWARHQFGASVGGRAAAVFEKVDCRLPRPSDWVNGPGGIKPDARPWSQVRTQYGFVDRFAALGQEVTGAGNRARFNYWLATFRYLRDIAHVEWVWAQFNHAMASVRAQTGPMARRQMAWKSALPLRRELVRLVAATFRELFATVSTTGGLGTVANWEQHLLPDLLGQPGVALEAALGQPLLPDARPPHDYDGPTRLIVPTVRSLVSAGDQLRLKVIVLSLEPPLEANLFSRPLGEGRFVPTPLRHVARGVYTVTVPKTDTAGDFEYYIKVVPARGAPVYFPSTAPSMNQTVVVAPTLW
jgi:Malectin domain